MSDSAQDLSIENGRDSPPHIPVDSPGSSASSRLKEEYSQLLKYTLESTPGLSTIIPFLQTTDTDKSQTEGGVETERNSNGNNFNLNSSGRDDDSSSEEHVSEETPRTSICTNPTVSQMSIKLCSWLGVLKENILAELDSSLTNSLELQHQEHLRASEQIQAEKVSLQKEVNQLTEQMNNLELGMKQKCTLINNLTDSLVAQKKKVEMARHFFHWKADHYDRQREIFTEKLAVQHHERKLNLRVLKAWYGVIQTRWRSRTERKSQTQAKEMCLSLTSDYETKVGMLNEKIAALEKKVSLLQAEQELYSEQVKKAFMRGMCALNMETMSVFGEEQPKQNQDESQADIQEVSMLDTNTLVTSLEEIESQSKLLPVMVDNVPSHTSQCHHSSRSPTRSTVVGSIQHSSISKQQQQQDCYQPKTSLGPCFASSKSKLPGQSKTKPKPSRSQTSNNNKVVGSSQVLAPPMASVVVERHPPVNKQTMGKATAVRYPKKETVPIHYSTSCAKNRGVGEMRFKPLAGQRDSRCDNRMVSNYEYIKVVD